MKASFFSVIAGAVVVAAQSTGGQPDCALPCLAPAIKAAGCALDDVPCQCGPAIQEIQTNAASCLLQSCSTAELRQAQAAGQAACANLSGGLLTNEPPTLSATASATGTLSSSTSTGVTITAAPSTASGSLTASGTGTLSSTSSTASNGVVPANNATRGGSNSTLSVTPASLNPTATNTQATAASSATANITATAGAVPARAVAKGVLAGAMGLLAIL